MEASQFAQNQFDKSWQKPISPNVIFQKIKAKWAIYQIFHIYSIHEKLF